MVFERDRLIARERGREEKKREGSILFFLICEGRKN